MDRYEEALERAKAGKPMDEVFPELKESEDERIRKAIESIIRVYGKTQGEWIAGYDMDTLVVHLRNAFLEEQKPNIELIQRSWYMEGYHDREFGQEPKWVIKTGKGGPKYEKNEKYGQPLEQQPAEWSEEDENKIESIKGLITTGRFVDTNTIRTIWKLLDSLRPKPHWKPSEEQISMLLAIVNDPNNAGAESCHLAMQSLYNDLKKLM